MRNELDVNDLKEVDPEEVQDNVQDNVQENVQDESAKNEELMQLRDTVKELTINPALQMAQTPEQKAKVLVEQGALNSPPAATDIDLRFSLTPTQTNYAFAYDLQTERNMYEDTLKLIDYMDNNETSLSRSVRELWASGETKSTKASVQRLIKTFDRTEDG